MLSKAEVPWMDVHQRRIMKSIWKRTCLLILPLALVFGVMAMMAQNGNQTYKAKRINRAIELLADKQPIYYTGSHTGAPGGAGARKPVLNRARRMRRRSPTTSAMTWSTRPMTSLG